MHFVPLLLAIPAICLGTLPAFAVPIRVSMDATVSGGIDTEGLFGSAGLDLTGQEASIRAIYDLDLIEPHQRVTTAGSDRASGGPLLGGVPNPILRIDVGIAGSSVTITRMILSQIQIGDFGDGPIFSMSGWQGRFFGLTLDADFPSGAPYPVSLDESWAQTFGLDAAGATLFSDGSEIAFDLASISASPAPIPLPATALLLLTGILGMVGLRKRRA